MKTTIRIASMALAMVLCIGCFTAGAFAADSKTLDFSSEVQTNFEGMLEGAEPKTIERTIYIEENYLASNWVSVGLIPYTICQWHGFSCSNKGLFTTDDFVIDYVAGGEYVTVETAVAQYDGWSCITAKLDFTDAAKSADLPIFVSGNFYFHHVDEQTDCQTLAIPFELLIVSKDGTYTDEQLADAKKAASSEPALTEDELASMTKVVGEEASEEETGFYHPEITNTKPETLIDGYAIADEAANVVSLWENGQSANVIYRTMNCGRDYGWQPVLSAETAAKLPCTAHGRDCAALAQCTSADVGVVLTENADLMNVQLRQGQNGVEMNLSMTEQARNATYPVTVRGMVYTEKTVDGVAHVSEGVPFAIELTGSPKISANGTAATSVICGVGGLLIGAAGMFFVLKRKKKEA